MIKIAVDAMGGDNAPSEIVKGAGLSEEVRLEENRPCIDTRFSEHGEETVVFLLIETDGVTVHRRIKFGISP